MGLICTTQICCTHHSQEDTDDCGLLQGEKRETTEHLGTRGKCLSKGMVFKGKHKRHLRLSLMKEFSRNQISFLGLNSFILNISSSFLLAKNCLREY